MTPALLALAVADTAQSWRASGFSVEAADVCHIGAVAIALRPEPGGRGVTGWAPAGGDGAGDGGGIDGLPTFVADEVRPHPAAAHANGTVAIDHLVVATPDVERTLGALAGADFELLRTREGQAYGQPMRQAFFRMNEVILEVVGPPDAAGDGPATFFGLAVTVADLDATATHLGEHLGAAKDAVQPGRRIATLRRSAGLSTAMAFMSPEPARG